MQIEEQLPPTDRLRHDPAGKEFRQTSVLEKAAAPAARSEGWSAFTPVSDRLEFTPASITPASDRLEDILLIPEASLEARKEIVQVEVLEDVFGGVEAPARSDEVNAFPVEIEAEEIALPVEAEAEVAALPVEGEGVEIQASRGDVDALHTSLMPSELAANDPALPSVESIRGQDHVYDKYTVGMRILRISPVWLLLSTLGFLSIIILFSWMSRPDGNTSSSPSDTALRNEATNQSLVPAQATAPVVEVAAAEPVAEQPAPPAPLAEEVTRQTAAVEANGNFTAQVGSYSDASQANERVSALRASGIEARAAAVEIPKRGTWYRVHAGRFQTREEATRFGAQLRARGLADSVIVAEVEKR
ncbi:MAG: SPOR domain-containing protein [Acidobacteria bacterium]|nr:SPOR domain-containing protein [Acidobacteriota bacterium]